jgi:hypothetical protein
MVVAIERGSTRFERSIGLRAGLLQGIYLCFVALLGALLFYLVINQEVSRIAPAPGLQEIKVSADRLGNAERVGIIRRLEADLGSEPLNLETIKKLVIYWAAAGETSRSDGLALVLAQRSFRDVEAQALALDSSLKKRDYAQSIRIMDAVLRTKPKSREFLFPVLRTLSDDPGALPSLVGVLANNPHWRTDFLIDLAKNGQNTGALSKLMTMLKKTTSPAKVNEVRALVIRLLEERNYDGAYYAWLDSLPVQDLKKVGLVFDGGFESNNRGLLFDWTFRRRKNVEVRIMSRGNSQADNALQIHFAKNNSPFADISQTLYLSAGNYRLEGEVRTENLQNERGLAWMVFCLSDAGEVLGATSRHNGTSDWMAFTADFSVPAEKCEMQRLVLVLDARLALDQNISGRIWYDNLKISNLDLIRTE